MTLFKSTLIIVFGVIVVFAISAAMYMFTQQAFGGTVRNENSGIIGYTCVPYSTSRATVGNQVLSTILSATTSRAAARIQLVSLSSSTVTLSLTGQTGQTLPGGLTLSSTTPYIDVGLATTFPYTGSVTGLTNNGSTTVEVTECVYPDDTVL